MRMKIEPAGHAGKIASVGPGDGLQYQQRIFDGARHGAELMERPVERHGAGARPAAVGGPQSGEAAAHAGADDAAAGFAANGETDQPRRGGRAGAGAGTGGAFLEEPGVHRLSAEPNIVEREGAEAELRKEHGACRVEALHDGGIVFGNAVAERLGAIGGRNSGGVQKILAAPGNTVKRSAILAGGDFLVGHFRLSEREIAREGDDATEPGIELFDAPQVDLREALGGEFALLDPARELRYRGKSDVRIAGGERSGGGLGADKWHPLGGSGVVGGD